MIEFCVCCGTDDVAGFYQAFDGPLHVEIFPLCNECLEFAEDVVRDLFIIDGERTT